MAALTTLIASEASLVQEAALAVPHSFDKCTHALGPIRQAVHLCLTCAVPRGLCSACSVACHGDHEQIELFPKRAFVCDCPTGVGIINCSLHVGAAIGNESNTYGQNFEAKFCRCRRPYDAKRERETMVQCVACEDWYHESCLNLRTRPNERPVSPDAPAHEPTDTAEVDSNASNDLPSPLLPSSTYDSFICGSCVLANDTLRGWAGTKGIMMVVREESDEEISPVITGGAVDPRWRVLNGEDDAVELNATTAEGELKRQRGIEGDGGDERPTMKKLRANSGSVAVIPLASSSVPQTEPLSSCLAPPVNPTAQHVLNRLHTQNANSMSSASDSSTIGSGDIFLTDGWRERWCRCPECFSSLEHHPYLLEEEETYEPPEDPDSGMSLEELGMRALMSLPRDRAIDGIRAYNAMRDELMVYLRPFAQEGRVVREEDVREFFETKAQEALG
ncbi:hypothetical protein K439DRAFT_1385634 [Ramaria rubella]|nr:hypothetical protein K439DRAFT_1385634 [Ramaria rubella]